MDDDRPPAFTVEAVTTALDEDDAREWLLAWSAAGRWLRTLMESDIAAAARTRERTDSAHRAEQRRFRSIVDASGD